MWGCELVHHRVRASAASLHPGRRQRRAQVPAGVCQRRAQEPEVSPSRARVHPDKARQGPAASPGPGQGEQADEDDPQVSARRVGQVREKDSSQLIFFSILVPKSHLDF